MKVVEGNFGNKEAAKETTFAEQLAHCLAHTGLKDKTGVSFILIVDYDERRTFISSHETPAESIMAMEQVKFTILGG